MHNIDLINPETFELANGLPVTLAGEFCSARPYSAIVFLAKCGLYTENAENNGITHALEHILFKGSNKYSNYDLTSIINKLGGSIDAFTTSDSLGIEVLVPHGRIDDALEVLSQLALKPAFPEDEIELEKKVIIEEMRFYRDDPEDLVMLKLEKSCYKGSCYSREILGTPESVSRLNKKTLGDYHRNYFTPSNCSLTIAGSFDVKKNAGNGGKAFRAGGMETRRFAGEKLRLPQTGQLRRPLLHEKERKIHSELLRDRISDAFVAQRRAHIFDVPSIRLFVAEILAAFIYAQRRI